MNRSRLVERLAERHTISKTKARLLVNLILTELSVALAKEERIEFRGFGSLFLKTYSSRQAKNPKTGLPVWIEPRKKIRFRASRTLLEKINSALL